MKYRNWRRSNASTCAREREREKKRVKTYGIHRVNIYRQSRDIFVGANALITCLSRRNSGRATGTRKGRVVVVVVVVLYTSNKFPNRFLISAARGGLFYAELRQRTLAFARANIRYKTFTRFKNDSVRDTHTRSRLLESTFSRELSSRD